MEEKKTKGTRRSLGTARKSTSKKKTEEVKETVVQEQEETKSVKAEVEFKNSDAIETKSVFAGSVTLVGRRTGNIYVWENLGDYQDVEYQDLLAEIRNRYSKYIYEPLILIENEDVIAKFPKLEELYSEMMDVDELTNAILDEEVDDLRDILVSLPTGLKDSVKSIVATLMQEGDLYDVRKIRLVDDLFGTALLEQMNLYK